MSYILFSKLIKMNYFIGENFFMLIIEEFSRVIDAIFRDGILTEKMTVKLPLVSLSRISRDSDLLRFRKVDSSTCPPISFGTSSFMSECKFATSSFPPMVPYSRTSLCKLLHRTRITSIVRYYLTAFKFDLWTI